LRNPSPQCHELLGVLQELDHLGQLLLGLVDPGHVREGDLRLVTGDHAGAAAPEGHGLVVAALGLAKYVVHEPADQEQEDQIWQKHAEPVGPAACLRQLHVDAVLLKAVSQRRRVVRQVNVVRDPILVDGNSVVALDVDRLHAPRLRVVDQLRIRPGRALRTSLELLPREPEHEAQKDDQDEIEQAGPWDTAQVTRLLGCSEPDSTTGNSGPHSMVTCTASPPREATQSPSTAIPGTQARRPSAKTSGRRSRRCRGTLASVSTSWSFRLPGAPRGRMRSPARL